MADGSSFDRREGGPWLDPRILIVGAGGLGTYLAGRMIQGGLPVTLYARPGRAEQLRSQGLRIESAHGNFAVPGWDVLAEGETTDRRFDAVVIGVKTYSLDRAVQAVAPLLSQRAVLVPLQNGGEHLTRLQAVIGKNRVAASAIYIESALGEDGTVRQTSAYQRWVIGEPEPGHEAVTRMAAALKAAQVDAEVRDFAGGRREMWLKWMFISPFAALTCLARADMAVALTDPHLRQLGSGLVRELGQVAEALGVELAADAVQRQSERLLALGHGAMTSMARDLLAGRPLELDAIHRAVVRLAQAGRVDAPCHKEVVDRLAPFEAPRARV